MKKLLITLLMFLSSVSLCWAPVPDKEMLKRSEEFQKVVSISEELDIFNKGGVNIPLCPFVELDERLYFPLSSKFGYRMHPVLNVVLLHQGIDVIVNKNQPILASGSGQVIKAITSKIGYGNHVIIKHQDGYSTLYGHLNEIKIKEGDNVQVGDIIGFGGQTGLVWGKSCNIHFELRKDGKAIDPLKFIGAKTVKEFAYKMYKLQELHNLLFGVN